MSKKLLRKENVRTKNAKQNSNQVPGHHMSQHVQKPGKKLSEKKRQTKLKSGTWGPYFPKCQKSWRKKSRKKTPNEAQIRHLVPGRRPVATGVLPLAPGTAVLPLVPGTAVLPLAPGTAVLPLAQNLQNMISKIQGHLPAHNRQFCKVLRQIR